MTAAIRITCAVILVAPTFAVQSEGGWFAWRALLPVMVLARLALVFISMAHNVGGQSQAKVVPCFEQKLALCNGHSLFYPTGRGVIGMVESSRLASVSATIIDDTMLARRYFQEAVKLNPADARTLGFLAGHTVIEGTLHQDERLMREGYFMLLDAIKAWPEFNLFTAGYVMSRLPADSPRFQDGVALFNAPNETADTRLMINSEFACMACHQE